MRLLVLERVEERTGLGGGHPSILGLLRFGSLGGLLLLFLSLLAASQ
jgi:hypothetical protein